MMHITLNKSLRYVALFQILVSSITIAVPSFSITYPQNGQSVKSYSNLKVTGTDASDRIVSVQAFSGETSVSELVTLTTTGPSWSTVISIQADPGNIITIQAVDTKAFPDSAVTAEVTICAYGQDFSG